MDYAFHLVIALFGACNSKNLVSLPPWPKAKYVKPPADFELEAWYPGNEECWTAIQPYKCVDDKTLLNANKAECENVKNSDGFEYMFNHGHEFGTGICGAGCSCCRRPIASSSGRVVGRERSFKKCCNRNRTTSPCWDETDDKNDDDNDETLSFRSCCSAASLKPSTWPRTRRVIVTVSTTVYRQSELANVLASLSAQTYKPDVIYLVLPLLMAKTYVWYEEIQIYSSTHPLVRILRCEQDYRAATDVLCVLQHEVDPDTYIWSVDDDMMYNPHELEKMLKRSAKHPGTLVTAMSYTSAGGLCRDFGTLGTCTFPSLAHNSYGLLFQRRFFDSGVFNFAAPALAYVRQGLDRSPSIEYIAAACQIADNVWLQGHLARKGIPRLYPNDFTGARVIIELAYHYSALSADVPPGPHTKNANDPKQLNIAEDTCVKALASFWGISLWSNRPRHVAAVILQGNHMVAAQIADRLATSGAAWWKFDSLVFFSCSGRTLPGWRDFLKSYGGLSHRFSYLHTFAPGLKGILRAPFASELFDLEAWMPKPLKWHFIARARLAPESNTLHHEHEGVVRPLADVVELCPNPATGDNGNSPCPTCTPAPSKVKSCPPGKVVRNACEKQVISDLDSAEPASLVCCYTFYDTSYCIPGTQLRNITEETASLSGFPSYVSLYAGHRICDSLALELCSPKQLVSCCDRTENVNQDPVWVQSPEAVSCSIQQVAAALHVGMDPEHLAKKAVSAGINLDNIKEAVDAHPVSSRKLLERIDEFMAWNEESPSTQIEWLSAREFQM